jgi:putative RNA 2'-phosphotransferase
MDQERKVKVSKYLSKHLRHQPERLGLKLEPGGWVEVDALLAACARQGFPVSRAELEEVVRTNEKQRFAFDETLTRIRANQGHTAAVDLQLEPVEPPAVLYHGTAEESVALVLRSGLKRMARHHVHLSLDVETAVKVGRRHGKPVVLVVDSGAMHRDGIPFYRSANGVWLVDRVPPQYLQPLSK